MGDIEKLKGLIEVYSAANNDLYGDDATAEALGLMLEAIHALLVKVATDTMDSTLIDYDARIEALVESKRRFEHMQSSYTRG